jgi:hypothetical protein
VGTQRRENFLNLQHAHQEALRKYSVTGKRIFLKNTAGLRPKVKGGHQVPGAFLQDKSFTPSFVYPLTRLLETVMWRHIVIELWTSELLPSHSSRSI